MKTYVGIDLGTSAVKVLLIAADGTILNSAARAYPVIYPQQSWTEQEPQKWIAATESALSELLSGQDKSLVAGISFGGQMHGLVALDGQGEVIRPCILWNDARSAEQTAYLNEVAGRQKLSSLTGNVAFAGFTAPKLLWLKSVEPYNFRRIAKILLPKDYLTYYFTGGFATDYSDASGTLLLDVKNRRWSEEMCALCGITVDKLPALYESYQPVGRIREELAQKFGLSNEVIICAGAGDNAAAAVGTGAVKEGDCNLSLGTSGTIFIPTDNFSQDGKNALHSFCHANGRWHLMGCILTAASARKWWLQDILGTNDYSYDECLIGGCDAGDIIFLPYLCGERSPHNDANARGAFINLTAQTTRAQLSRAVMEGVAFAIRDCLEAAYICGAKPASTTLCGGGAKSEVWQQIVADILNLPVNVPATEQGPAYGAAMLAMVGCGEYKSVEEAAQSFVKISRTVRPVPESVERYKPKYELFKRLYPALKQANGK